MILRNRNIEHFFKYILSACLMDSLHFFEYVNQLCTGFYKCRNRLQSWCPSSATNKQTITLNNKQNHICIPSSWGRTAPKCRQLRFRSVGRLHPGSNTRIPYSRLEHNCHWDHSWTSCRASLSAGRRTGHGHSLKEHLHTW